MSLELFRRLDAFRALARVEFVQESADDHVRLADSPGVVLATDRPVEEAGYIEGRFQRFLLKLRMTKAMLGRWRKSGLLNPDGSALMMRDHGTGWGNKVTDVVGRWENLRIEDRDGYRALVADPAFDPAMMGAWMTGAGLESDAWRGLIIRRTLTHTSVGFKVDAAKMRKLDDEDGKPTYEADWDLLEGSWVWKGADTMAGMDRASNQGTRMDPDQIAELAAKAGAEAAAKVIADNRSATSEKPAIVLEPIKERTAFDDAAPAWQSTVTIAYRDLGPTAGDEVAKARTSDDPLSTLLAVIDEAQKKRQSAPTPPPNVPAPVGAPRTIEGGEQNAYRAIQDLETVLIARGMRDVGNGARERKDRDKPGTLAHLRAQAMQAADKVSPYHSQMDPMRFLTDFARSVGAVEPGWYATSPREVMESLAAGWEPSSHARSATMGGLWIPGKDCVRAQSGTLDVLASLRHGAQSGVVPANLPAIYLSVVTKIFLMVHDTQIHNFMNWGRNISAADLNAQTLIRKDLAVTFDKVTGSQDLPEAFVWDEAVEIKTAPRGITWSLGWEAMFTNGGQELVNTPAMLAMRWMGAKVNHWFKTLFAGLYTVKGGSTINAYTTGAAAKNATESDLGVWFEAVLTASGDARPVALPANGLLQGTQADVPAIGTMEPDLLLYGNRTNKLVSDHFAPRQASRRNDVELDEQLTDFEQILGANRVRTPYIPDRTIYAIITGGPAAAMTWVGLDGQGMQITTATDTNIRRLPDMTVRIIDAADAFLTHPEGAYRNNVPA